MIVLSGALNNRDHRKIMIVDGVVAFSGGINLADEYINEAHPFGHWKDIGFRITGDAIRSYAYMFIEFWNASSLNKITKELVGSDFAGTPSADGMTLTGTSCRIMTRPAGRRRRATAFLSIC